MRNPARIFHSIPLVFAVLTFWTGGALAQQAVQYSNDSGSTGWLCSPSVTPVGTIVLIHGGGWTGGSADSFKGLCQSFAKRGYVAFSPSYKLASEQDSESQWPRQLADVKSAVAWVEGRYPKQKICLYGESSGGQLALLTAAAGTHVACVVSAFSPTKLNRLGPAFTKSFQAMFGDVSSPKLTAASPADADLSKMPPVLAVQGIFDDLVPQEQATILVEALKRSKRDVRYVSYQGGHSWQNIEPATKAKIDGDILEFFASKLAR
jgi:acetyl esterase/lipase